MPTRRIVIGTATRGHTVKAYAVEVSETDPASHATIIAGLIHTERGRKGHASQESIDNVRQYLDNLPEPDPAQALSAIEAGDWARLLTYAGIPEAAQADYSGQVPRGALIRGLGRIRIEGRSYRGRSIPIRTGPGILTVFTGTDEALLRAAILRNPVDARDAAGQAHDERIDTTIGRPVRTQLSGRSRRTMVATIAADGTVLALSGNEPTVSAVTD